MHRMILALAACALLAACATPSVDPGFVIRSDLKTTNCDGQSTKALIDATPGDDDAFHFMTRRTQPLAPPEGQPDQRLRVQDCTRPSETVLVAAGLRLQPGDVLYVSTGAVGPTYDINGTLYKMHSPATLGGPAQIVLRQVHPKSGRLYAEEDQFLAAALSMAVRHSSQKFAEPLASALDRQQLFLWNALMRHLRLWRPPMAAKMSTSPRVGLALLVDTHAWCDEIRTTLVSDDSDSEAKDRGELLRFFSGSETGCPGDTDPRVHAEFSRISAPARSAVQAVGSGSRPADEGYFYIAQQALYTQVSADLKGARLGAPGRASSLGAWTLADWQHSGICRDGGGKSLAIDAFRLEDGKWVYVKTASDEVATVRIQQVFTQTLQERRFVESGRWWQRWKLVIDEADLDHIYGREITAIKWRGEPAYAAMCQVHTER